MKPSQESNPMRDKYDNQYKAYDQRGMRTDDIQGAAPRSYGNFIPQNSTAGAPTGNTKLKNQSEVFNHINNY